MANIYQIDYVGLHVEHDLETSEMIKDKSRCHEKSSSHMKNQTVVFDFVRLFQIAIDFKRLIQRANLCLH